MATKGSKSTTNPWSEDDLTKNPAHTPIPDEELERKKKGTAGQTAETRPPLNPIPEPPRTAPIEPIGMTPSVEGESNRLCWAGKSGGAEKNPVATPQEEMPDLTNPEDAIAYLKENPSAMWYMSKAEIIAMIGGPEMAKAYNENEPPPDEQEQQEQQARGSKVKGKRKSGDNDEDCKEELERERQKNKPSSQTQPTNPAGDEPSNETRETRP